MKWKPMTWTRHWTTSSFSSTTWMNTTSRSTTATSHSTTANRKPRNGQRNQNDRNERSRNDRNDDHKNTRKVRMDHKTWRALTPEDQRSWDAVTDDGKTKILSYAYTQSKRTPTGDQRGGIRTNTHDTGDPDPIDEDNLTFEVSAHQTLPPLKASTEEDGPNECTWQPM